MSELRDLTVALRAFDRRIAGVEDCLVILSRESRQQTEWRHQQKNNAQVSEGLRLQAERAMLQIQEACGAISHKVAELVERLDNQASTRLSDVKELRERTRQIELRLPAPSDEITKA